MKCKAVYCVLLLCFCFSIFSINSSAVDVVSEDGVLQEYDSEGNLIAEYYSSENDFSFSTFALKSKNYNWSPDSIDWASFPSYIRAIAYSPYDCISYDSGDGSTVDLNHYRSPFIMITCNGTEYTIRAGWDVSLLYRESTGNTTLGFHKTMLEHFSPELHMATFKCSDNSVVSKWAEKTYSSWGTTGNCYNYSGTGIGISDSFDVYTYGNNASWKLNASSVSYPLTSDESVYCQVNNKGRGILDMSDYGFRSSFVSAASDMYFSTFTPAAPNDYSVQGSTTFGLQTKMLTNDAFLFHEDLPFGLNSLIFGFCKNGNNTYHLITDSNADVHFLRNWDWSSPNKFKVTVLSSSPIYRVSYSSTSGGYASMSSSYGLTASDLSGSYSDGPTSWHSTVRYYINKGYYAYWYSIEGNIYSTISNNSAWLNVDGSLSFSHSYGAYPTADTLSQILQSEQNNILNEQNSILDEQNALIDEGNKTQSGIWETLKGIPEAISEKIKSLFVPDENFFDTYTTDFQDYFSDRFGLLYELPEAGVGILQQFIDFEPVTDGYYIPVPEVVFPVTLEDGTVEDFVILEKQNYVFDFLSEGVIGTLYSFYRAFCWLIAILSLIALAVRKYNKITGGGG